MITTRDGNKYVIGTNGARIRIEPPCAWRGKSERRRVIKERREERQTVVELKGKI
jgi:hypothetical protein